MLLGAMLLASAALLIGCTKKEGGAEPSGSGSSSTPQTASADAGKATFTASCSKCHAINGTGGQRAPDLSHVGADATHTAQWLADYVKDPKSKDPGSRMPAFGNRLSDTELQSLGAYLASLK